MLLPTREPTINRPSKVACHALLSRIHLQLGAVDSALAYADQVLRVQGDLLDYNELDDVAPYPFPTNGLSNPEVILFDGSNMGSFFYKLHVHTAHSENNEDAHLPKRFFSRPVT